MKINGILIPSSTGNTGPTGSAGPTGGTGSTGNTGPQGVSSNYYYYKANTLSTTPPPASGYLIWNNVTQISATSITLSHITNDSVDVETFLALATVGSTVIVQDVMVSGNYQKWTITGTPIQFVGSYVTLPVAYVSGGYSFSNNQSLIVAIQSVGQQGVPGATGAGGALGYYGNFYDDQDQPFVTPGTAQIVGINSDNGSVGFSLSGTGTVVIANPGTYTMIYSIQLKNIDNAIHYADIWLKYNGSDYPDSTTRFHVPARKNASEFGYAVATVNFVGTSVAPGDYVELWWHADSTQVSIEYLPAGVAPVHPATPSVIATFTQVMYTQLGPTGATGPIGPTGSSPTLSAGTGITLTGTPLNYTIGNTFTAGCFGITIDGGGSVITTGLKGYIQIPYNCTITGWIVLPDQNSSIVVDVWKTALINFPPTVSNSIAGTEKPTVISGDYAQDLALTTWTTAVTAGDIIAFNVDSASVVTRATIQILTLRT